MTFKNQWFDEFPFKFDVRKHPRFKRILDEGGVLAELPGKDRMTFEQWLDEVFGKDFKHSPDYDEQLHLIGCGNLRKAWDAGFKEGVESKVSRDKIYMGKGAGDGE